MTVITEVLTISNQRGLHARASAKLVRLMESFPQTQVMIEKDGEIVSATSIMGLMMLGAGMGSQIKVTANGEKASQVVADIKNLIENRFDEDI